MRGMEHLHLDKYNVYYFISENKKWNEKKKLMKWLSVRLDDKSIKGSRGAGEKKLKKGEAKKRINFLISCSNLSSITLTRFVKLINFSRFNRYSHPLPSQLATPFLPPLSLLVSLKL